MIYTTYDPRQRIYSEKLHLQNMVTLWTDIIFPFKELTFWRDEQDQIILFNNIEINNFSLANLK